jgi:hypothetical protein
MPKKPPKRSQKQQKVAQVMREYKEQSLHSSSGQKVTNPKQAVAIALSEAGLSRPKATRKPATRNRKKPPDVVTVQRS